MVLMMAAKPMRSVPEKEVPSHKTENTVADSGSEEASMEDLEGPISTMDCMMREKGLLSMTFRPVRWTNRCF